uniref:Zinc finger, CCHC-type n=1 Tax=Syphacia muris TaxID=451379 RepID=A0A0N5AID5_9BILA
MNSNLGSELGLNMAVNIPHLSSNSKRFEKYRTPKWTAVFDKHHMIQSTFKKFSDADSFHKVEMKMRNGRADSNWIKNKEEKLGFRKIYSFADPFANVPDLKVDKLSDCGKRVNELGSSERRKECKDVCICHRPASVISCVNCGKIFHGRARRICPVHPKRMDLMDIGQCWRCSSSNIWEEE